MSKCIACNGTGYYDSVDKKGRSIRCFACDGTGYENTTTIIDTEELQELKRLAKIGKITEYAIKEGFDFAWGSDEYFTTMNFEQMKNLMKIECSQQPTTTKQESDK